MNCIGSPKAVKCFFASNSPLFRKSCGGKKKKGGNYEAFCFLSKRNNKAFNNMYW